MKSKPLTCPRCKESVDTGTGFICIGMKKKGKWDSNWRCMNCKTAFNRHTKEIYTYIQKELF